MELLALGKPIKKPPRSDERDGELFCGTTLPPLYFASGVASYGRNITMTSGLYTKGTAIIQTVSHGETYQGVFSLDGISSAKISGSFGYYGANAISKDGLTVSVPVNGTVFDVSNYDILFINQTDISGSSYSMSITLS